MLNACSYLQANGVLGMENKMDSSSIQILIAMLIYMAARAFENLDLGTASAAAVILLILVLAFSVVNLLLFERDKYKGKDCSI